MDDKIDLHWLACELDHDIKNVADGLERVRWNNRAMMLMLREIRGREQLCKELAASLISLLPGYEQYLDWAADRGVFGLKEGRELLKRAYLASKIDPAVATTRALARAGLTAEVDRTLATLATSLADIGKSAQILLSKLRACQD